jgi:hypothetical protein
VVPAEQQISAGFLRWRRIREPGQPALAGERFFWARNAIYQALSVLGIGPGDQVLLPAYICNSAVDPVLGRGAEVAFYDVGRDCEAHPAEIEARIGRRTRAVMIVHYCGFLQRVDRLRELCDRRGVLLIEDCAHVLRSEGSGHAMGRVGDAAVFSWRKFLPVQDGAALVVNGVNRIGEVVDGEPENLMLTLRSVKDAQQRVADGGDLRASAQRGRVGGSEHLGGERDVGAHDLGEVGQVGRRAAQRGHHVGEDPGRHRQAGKPGPIRPESLGQRRLPGGPDPVRARGVHGDGIGRARLGPERAGGVDPGGTAARAPLLDWQ